MDKNWSNKSFASGWWDNESKAVFSRSQLVSRKWWWWSSLKLLKCKMLNAALATARESVFSIAVCTSSRSSVRVVVVLLFLLRTPPTNPHPPHPFPFKNTKLNYAGKCFIYREVSIIVDLANCNKAEHGPRSQLQLSGWLQVGETTSLW